MTEAGHSRFDEDLTLSDVISDDDKDAASTPSTGSRRESREEASDDVFVQGPVPAGGYKLVTHEGKANRSQFSANKCDLIHVTANRFTYSTQYILGYALLTVLSVLTVAISLSEPKGCPPLSFYFLEMFVLMALMAEVGVRILALRRFFWKSYWNIADGVMMLICIVTLALVFAGCNKAVRLSRQSSTILLVIRNIVQIGRLLNLIWRNRSNIENRQVDIDLDNVQDMGFELLPEQEGSERLWDLEDEQHRR
jgi:hypothetical protein